MQVQMLCRLLMILIMFPSHVPIMYLHFLLVFTVLTRAGKFIYRYQECLDFASKSNNLTDRFLFFLHFEAVLLNFLSSFIYIS